MGALSDEFARSNFESRPDPNALVMALAAEMTRLLQESASPLQTAAWMVDALRNLGHDLHLYDDDGGGFQYFTDNWVSRRSRFCMSVWFQFASDDRPALVDVTFVPRVEARTVRHCPACDVEMGAAKIRLFVEGHGSATQPGLRVEFSLGSEFEVNATAGARSLGPVLINGYQCPRCKGCWFPPAKRVVPGT